MPTYEYECLECANRFEVFQNIKDEPVKVCAKCGGKVRRVINGGAGIIFKGSGFYVTDNHGKNAAAAEPKTETKSSSAGPSPGASAPAACENKASCPAGASCPHAA